MKRNRTITYSDENPVYFITTTVTGHTKIFAMEDLCDLALKDLDFYRKKHNFAIYGFVIMPTHVYLLLQQLGAKTISDFMRDFKKHTAVEIIKYCKNNNLRGFLEIFRKSAEKYMRNRRSRYQVWQERFDDVVVFSEKVFRTKLNYIHNNPVQDHWNLSDAPWEYKYSSARNHHLEDDSIFHVVEWW
ncbi:MAG: hypothetical protein ABIH66_13505 [bacterium]